MAVSAAKYFEVRWRVKDSGENYTPPRQTSPVSALAIEELEASTTYDIEVRAVSACGAKSLWAAYEITTPANTQRVSQSNINMLRVGGIGSAWTGFSISYTSTPTAATISCTAGTLQDGASNPSYAASSVTVSGAANTTVHYWLYYDDPTGAGGTVTLGATTTYSDLSANQGRINVGDLDVTFPASGTGGGSGNPGGGGCVVVDSFVMLDDGTLVRAGDIAVGDVLRLFDPVTLEARSGTVSYSVPKMQPCVEIVTRSGKVLRCSTSAPIPTLASGLLLAPNIKGEHIAIHDGSARWDRVVSVKPIGEHIVQHITCENGCFWADGVGHHNLKPVGP